MRLPWLVMLAGCSDSGVPIVGIGDRSPTLSVSEGILQDGPDQFRTVIHATLFDDTDPTQSDCFAVPSSFGGTLGGQEMQVYSFGGERIGDFQCSVPSLVIDQSELAGSGSNLVELHDDTGSVSATFSGDLFERRIATATSFDLHSGQPLVVTWSHPGDLVNANPSLLVTEVCATCEPRQVAASGTVTAPDQITFVPVFHAAMHGRILFRPKSDLVGDPAPVTCTALHCRATMSGFFLVDSTLTP